MHLCNKIYKGALFLKSVMYHFFVVPGIKGMLKTCGKDVHFEYGCRGNWNNISIGNDVHFGQNNLFMCSNAPILIGSHVMFGPNVTMISGDHRTDVVGKYMSEIRVEDKLQEDDQPICLRGDNWIGANVVILKGVTIGEGAIVAAGAIVTTNVPEYSIVAGVPAKVIKKRFDDIELQRHKDILNKKEKINSF